jgi:hypothetical protein
MMLQEGDEVWVWRWRRRDDRGVIESIGVPRLGRFCRHQRGFGVVAIVHRSSAPEEVLVRLADLHATREQAWMELELDAHAPRR